MSFPDQLFDGASRSRGQGNVAGILLMFQCFKRELDPLPLLNLGLPGQVW